MWLNLLFNIVLPLLTLVILNRAIYNKLNQVKTSLSYFFFYFPQLWYWAVCVQMPPSDCVSVRRSIEPRLRKREQRLARISLLIVLIFIICHSVKNIPTIFEIIGKDPRVSDSQCRLPIAISEIVWMCQFVQFKNIELRIRNSNLEESSCLFPNTSD